jgi:hypothetical protein
MVKSIGTGGPSNPTDSWWPEESVVLEALSGMIRPACIEAALRATGRKEKRKRRLPAAAVLWLVIAFGIWSESNVPTIWRRLGGTLRALLRGRRKKRPPVKSAFSEARRRLGVAPLRRVFRETARPIATDRTMGAFYHGLRLKVIDGVHLDVPDTVGNVAAFGRSVTTRWGENVPAAYPQIVAVCLSEVGTHVILDALVKPGRTGERKPARVLLKRVSEGDLVLWDRGFYGYDLLAEAIAQGAHVLGRLPAGVIVKPIECLADGSFLAKVYPDASHRRKDRGGLLVRIVRYTIDDPTRTGHQEEHRLVTTLLDDRTHPALDLIQVYHDRWEIEIVNDEVKTHLLARLVHLRSRTPWGIVQEFYGLLLAYNAVRNLMHEAALAEDIAPRRLSFVDSVRLIRDTVQDMRNAPTKQLPVLYQGLLALIGQCQLPPRENRINPRVVKRKMSKFAKKRPEHYRLPHPEKPFRETVVMLNPTLFTTRPGLSDHSALPWV